MIWLDAKLLGQRRSGISGHSAYSSSLIHKAASYQPQALSKDFFHTLLAQRPDNAEGQLNITAVIGRWRPLPVFRPRYHNGRGEPLRFTPLMSSRDLHS